jgi:TRAP-type transport system periplasmic protein
VAHRNSRQSRIRLTSTAMLLACAGVITACSSAPSSATGATQGEAANLPSMTIDFSSPFPSSGQFEADVLNTLASEVAAKTGGKLKIKIFPHSQLGTNADVLTKLQTGAIKMGIIDGATTENVASDVAIFDLPYTYASTSGETLSMSPEITKIITGPVGKAVGTQLSSHNIQLLGWEMGGVRTTVSKSPLPTLASMKGVKVRTTISYSYTTVISAMGMNPLNADITDLAAAFATGLVKAADLTPEVVLGDNYYQDAKYLQLTGQMISPLQILMNKQAFDSLPAQYQQVLSSVSQSVGLASFTSYVKAYTSAIKELQQKGMVVVPVDLNALNAAVKPTIPEIVNKFGIQSLYQQVQSDLGQ